MIKIKAMGQTGRKFGTTHFPLIEETIRTDAGKSEPNGRLPIVEGDRGCKRKEGGARKTENKRKPHGPPYRSNEGKFSWLGECCGGDTAIDEKRVAVLRKKHPKKGTHSLIEGEEGLPLF